MKKVLCVCILAFTSCFAIPLKVTKVIPSLNLYILDNAYVVKTSCIIKDVKVGSIIDIDADAWLNEMDWVQEVLVDKTQRYWEFGCSYVRFYETIEKCVFSPIGLIGHKPMNKQAFASAILAYGNEDVLESYFQTYKSNEWNIGLSKTVFSKRFFDAEGIKAHLDWMLEPLDKLPKKFKHKIHLIYSITEPNKIVGVYHASIMRKVCLDDEVFGLALFHKSTTE